MPYNKEIKEISDIRKFLHYLSGNPDESLTQNFDKLIETGKIVYTKLTKEDKVTFKNFWYDSEARKDIWAKNNLNIPQHLLWSLCVYDLMSTFAELAEDDQDITLTNYGKHSGCEDADLKFYDLKHKFEKLMEWTKASELVARIDKI